MGDRVLSDEERSAREWEGAVWARLHARHVASGVKNCCCPLCFPDDEDLSMADLLTR